MGFDIIFVDVGTQNSSYRPLYVQRRSLYVQEDGPLYVQGRSLYVQEGGPSARPVGPSVRPRGPLYVWGRGESPCTSKRPSGRPGALSVRRGSLLYVQRLVFILLYVGFYFV